MSQIVIISGAPGSGKTRVAEALCKRYARAVHLETDAMYGWIRMGYVHRWKAGDNSPNDRQNDMVTRAAARAAGAFAADEFDVFVDGVIGRSLLDIYLEELRCCAVPVSYIVLRPPADESIRRMREREKERLTDGGPQFGTFLDKRPPHAEDGERFKRVLSMFAPIAAAGITIDNAGLSVEQTADRVIGACASGEALVHSPAPFDISLELGES